MLKDDTTTIQPRAIWDEQHAKWWFSGLDIVGVLNEEPDYTKVRNYWKYLKAKPKKENNQLVSATTQLKPLAADHKKYNTTDKKKDYDQRNRHQTI